MKCELLYEWDDVLRAMCGGAADVYLTRSYHNLYRADAATPVCFLARSGANQYILPGMLHRIVGDERMFFESAYGYGGPLSTSRDSDFVNDASASVCSLLDELGVARARLRFHPVFQNQELVGPEWDVSYSRDTAGMDLAGTPDSILESMHPKHRNMVSRAQRLGLQFAWDTNLTYLEEFKALYNRTMDRLQADAAYYYDDSYYEMLGTGLAGHVALGVVLNDGVAVSAALFFKEGPYGHYHLSGSCDDVPPGAGQLLLYRAAVALQQAGARILHLGGGTSTSPDDSLLKFKQRFGSLRFQYHVGIWTSATASR